MSKGLKGITVKIDGDTTPLNQALSKTNANARSLQGELKGVNSLLKLDPTNTDLLAQKQTILAQAVSETEDKMKLLTQAQEEMVEAGKDINDEAFRDLQREIVATQQKLAGMKSEQKTLQQLAKETESFGQKLGNLVQKIPVVNKVASAFVSVKGKITETVKESAAVQKIGTAVENVKKKVESFKDAHPKVVKIAEAFGTVKDKAKQLVSNLPSVTNGLKSIGSAAAGAAGNLAKIGFKVAGAAAVGAATAIGTLTTKAIQGFAEFEQLTGGVETLFGKSAETVTKYADNAYKTAGMSANKYMETVTGFSASLLQSLDGDTEAAAQKADQAITDMSDNANKMGTSIDSIQNAYQGFAKQNYTMLDNLKLGYGGTKEEMQRLLDDAQALSGVEYDISSYADVVDAIHVIQDEMGITGTTAREATSTIQGSVQAASGAWSNWITGMANDEADFGELTQQLIDAVMTVIDNVVPRIMQTIPRLVEGLGQLLQQIAQYLPDLIQQLLPPLLEGIVQAIPQLIAMLPQIISSIVNTLIANLPQIISAGITLLGALISGIIQAIPQLVAAIPQIVTAIFDTIKAVNWGELGKNIIDGVITGVKNAASSLIEVFKDLASSALDSVKEFFGIASPSKVMRDEVGKMLPAGMAIGVEEGMDEEEDRIKKAMQRGVPTTIDSYMANAGSRTPQTGQAATAGGFTQNITINSPQALSPSETARLNRNATRQMVLKLKPT